MPIKYLNRNNKITVSAGTQKAIFGYGYNGSPLSMTNLVSNTGVAATDTTGVGTARTGVAATGYGTDKAIFGYGDNGSSTSYSTTNLVSNNGVVATNTTGVGTARSYLAAAGYGTDKAIFAYGYTPSPATGYSISNLVSNTGVVATNTTGVGTARWGPSAARYGSDKSIFGYGQNSGTYVSITNLVSNTGVVATDTTGVGTARYLPAAAGYGSDKAIFGYGTTGTNTAVTNLVSNTGVVATDTTGVGTARFGLAGAGYGSDKAIFGYGSTGTLTAITNLVSNTGVVATDTAGVGTARQYLAAAGYSAGTSPAPGGIAYKNRNSAGTSTPTGNSVQFNGSNQYLSIANNAAFDFGTGDFTVEGWVYLNNNSTTAIVGTRTNDTSLTIRWCLYVGDGFLSCDVWNTSNARIALFAFQSTIPAGTWIHCALVRSGTSFRLYQNGIQSTNSATSPDAVSNSSTAINIGSFIASGVSNLNGNISNLRIVKGTALYTASFSVPTSPLTAIANTSLLACQSATIVDNSTNNLTITNNNSATVSSITPFTVVTATSTMKMKKVYSDAGISIITSGLVLNLDASNASSYPGSGTSWFDLSGNSNNGTLTNGPTFNSANGGSIVFDGSDDYVQVINGYTNTLKNNNNWSVSFWFKANSLSNDPVLLGPEVGQLNYYDLFLEVGINSIYFGAGGGSGVNYLTNSSVSLAINTIYNIVYIKTGITTGKVFLNGIEVPLSALGTGLGSMPNSNADFRIGTFKAGSFSLNGNIYQTLIYNKSLSAPEVLQNYNVTKAKFGL